MEDRAAQKGIGLHVSANPEFREAFLLNRFPGPQQALIPAVIQKSRWIVFLPERDGADPDEQHGFKGFGVEIRVEADGLIDQKRENDDEQQDGCPEEDPLPVRFRFRVRCHVRSRVGKVFVRPGPAHSPRGTGCFRRRDRCNCLWKL